MQINTCE